MEKRKTLAAVAAVAGVSKMTVSRALRGDKDVSPKTVEKVTKAAREIGYIGNVLASSLAGQKSGLIGVILPSLQNIIFAQVLNSITNRLHGTTLQPVFGVSDYDEEREYDLIRNMLSWHPSGLIVTGVDFPEQTKDLLRTTETPLVQIMDTDGDAVGACVGFSHYDVGCQMARTLVGLGHQNFAYIGSGLERDIRARKRWAGFTEQLKKEGLKLQHQFTDTGLSSTAKGRRLIKDLWAEAKGLDCIYFSSDYLASGAYNYLTERGVKIPEQLALVGFNGLDFLDSTPGKIATTRTPQQKIGTLAVDLILSAVERNSDLEPEKHVLDPEIDLGELA